MAVGNFTFYDTGKEALLTDNANQIAWATDSIYAVLVGAAYTPAATHSTWADVSANHVSGTNYAPVALANKTSARSGGTLLWDCDDIDFGANVTVTAKYVVILKRDGGALAGTDKLIGYGDLDNTSGTATVSSTNSVFKVGTGGGLFDV
jgi:hypothetical protein